MKLLLQGRNELINSRLLRESLIMKDSSNCRFLLTAYYSLLTTHYSLPPCIGCSLLPIAYCLLPIVYSVLKLFVGFAKEALID